MTEQETRKLAEFAGFKLLDTQFHEHSFGTAEVETWQYPNGETSCYLPDFFDISALFKWVVSKFSKFSKPQITFQELMNGRWRCDMKASLGLLDSTKYSFAAAETPGLSLRMAILKLIE